MSQTTVLNNGQQAITNTDVSKIFVWNNRYESAVYTNDTYDDVTLVAGTLLGRIHASGKVIPLESDASDGSQFPVGVLAHDVTVEGGEDQGLSFCVAGDVVEAKIVLTKEGDTLDTVISARRIRDRIGSDTVGIKLVGGIEMSAYDNQ